LVVPKKVSTKLSDNIAKFPYGTPTKMSHGHIGKSFEFSSDSDNEGEAGDRVENLLQPLRSEK
jgi:hypothetical protein